MSASVDDFTMRGFCVVRRHRRPPARRRPPRARRPLRSGARRRPAHRCARAPHVRRDRAPAVPPQLATQRLRAAARAMRLSAASPSRPNRLRTCRSRCGYGISIPCALSAVSSSHRYAAWIAALRRAASSVSHTARMNCTALVAEADQPHLRRLPAFERQRERHPRRGFQRGLLHQFLVDAVGDLERHPGGRRRLNDAMRPVDHAAGDEFGIGHQHVDVVVGGDAGGADVDGAHRAAHLGVEFDEVADLERAVEQQDQSSRRSC